MDGHSLQSRLRQSNHRQPARLRRSPVQRRKNTRGPAIP